MNRITSILASAVLLGSAVGCQVQSSLGAGGTAPAAPPPAQPAAGGSAGGEASTAGNPECPNPENHCLPDGVIMVANKELSPGYQYVEPANAKGGADATGQAMFFGLRQGKDLTSRWYWETRPAAAADVQVGRRVFMLHIRAGNTYHAPRTRQEATSRRWWTATVASVAPMNQGYVIVSGGYQIATDALRVADSIQNPAVLGNLATGEDGHFLTPDHWLVGKKALSGNYIYVSAAAAIKAPSAETGGEGQFLSLRDGKVSWSKHAWKTRPATAAELRPGVQVFMLHQREGKSYRRPKDRTDALGRRWWTAKVTDASQAYKGMVTVAGGYLINIDAIRVAN